MPKTIEDLYKELSKTNKQINNIENKVLKDMSEIIKVVKYMDKKISQILSKIQEFEIIADSIDINEETEEDWNPYSDSYQPEEYESYDDDYNDDTSDNSSY